MARADQDQPTTEVTKKLPTKKSDLKEMAVEQGLMSPEEDKTVGEIKLLLRNKMEAGKDNAPEKIIARMKNGKQDSNQAAKNQRTKSGN